jgi:hypothetical protein
MKIALDPTPFHHSHSLLEVRAWLRTSATSTSN